MNFLGNTKKGYYGQKNKRNPFFAMKALVKTDLQIKEKTQIQSQENLNLQLPKNFFKYELFNS